MTRRWWIGLVTGLVGAAGTVLTGPLGGVLAMVAIGLAVADRPRAAAIGGVLVGIGAAWSALFGRVALACQEGCDGPDLTPWIALAVVLASLGAVVTWRASRRPG